MTKLTDDAAKEADYLVHKCLSEIFKSMVWYSNSEGRFGETGRKGDTGERVVERYLSDKGIAFEKKTDPHSQRVLKIDFIVDGKTMDVKTNAFGAVLAVEVYDSKLNEGWVYTSTADEIYGVDLKDESIYKYKLSDMKEYATKNKHKAKLSENGAYILYVPKTHPMIERLQ